MQSITLKGTYCDFCDGSNFYEHECGYYVCSECGVNSGINHTVVLEYNDIDKRGPKIKYKQKVDEDELLYETTFASGLNYTSHYSDISELDNSQQFTKILTEKRNIIFQNLLKTIQCNFIKNLKLDLLNYGNFNNHLNLHNYFNVNDNLFNTNSIILLGLFMIDNYSNNSNYYTNIDNNLNNSNNLILKYFNNEYLFYKCYNMTNLNGIRFDKNILKLLNIKKDSMDNKLNNINYNVLDNIIIDKDYYLKNNESENLDFLSIDKNKYIHDIKEQSFKKLYYIISYIKILWFNLLDSELTNATNVLNNESKSDLKKKGNPFSDLSSIFKERSRKNTEEILLNDENTFYKPSNTTLNKDIAKKNNILYKNYLLDDNNNSYNYNRKAKNRYKYLNDMKLKKKIDASSIYNNSLYKISNNKLTIKFIQNLNNLSNLILYNNTTLNSNFSKNSLLKTNLDCNNKYNNIWLINNKIFNICNKLGLANVFSLLSFRIYIMFYVVKNNEINTINNYFYQISSVILSIKLIYGLNNNCYMFCFNNYNRLKTIYEDNLPDINLNSELFEVLKTKDNIYNLINNLPPLDLLIKKIASNCSIELNNISNINDKLNLKCKNSFEYKKKFIDYYRSINSIEKEGNNSITKKISSIIEFKNQLASKMNRYTSNINNNYIVSANVNFYKSYNKNLSNKSNNSSKLILNNFVSEEIEFYKKLNNKFNNNCNYFSSKKNIEVPIPCETIVKVSKHTPKLNAYYSESEMLLYYMLSITFKVKIKQLKGFVISMENTINSVYSNKVINY